MSKRPLFVLTGGSREILDLRTLRAKQHRVSRALLKASRMIEAALREYDNAQQIAAEDHDPIDVHTHRRIVDSLVNADCLVRTQVALRAASKNARTDPGQPLEADPEAVDEET